VKWNRAALTNSAVSFPREREPRTPQPSAPGTAMCCQVTIRRARKFHWIAAGGQEVVTPGNLSAEPALPSA